MEGFPKPQRSSAESEKETLNEQETISPTAIEPIVHELKKQVAEIEPVVTSDYALSPEKADDLRETLKDIGAK